MSRRGRYRKFRPNFEPEPWYSDGSDDSHSDNQNVINENVPITDNREYVVGEEGEVHGHSPDPYRVRDEEVHGHSPDRNLDVRQGHDEANNLERNGKD